jgi:hypothetical protein
MTNYAGLKEPSIYIYILFKTNSIFEAKTGLPYSWGNIYSHLSPSWDNFKFEILRYGQEYRGLITEKNCTGDVRQQQYIIDPSSR